VLAGGDGSGAGSSTDGLGFGSGAGGRGGIGGGHVLPLEPSDPPPDGGHDVVIGRNPPHPRARAHVRTRCAETTRRAKRLLVAPKWEALGRKPQENDWPQPQVRVVFGLLIVNPAPCRPSL
jgi:hypothetical protein